MHLLSRVLGNSCYRRLHSIPVVFRPPSHHQVASSCNLSTSAAVKNTKISKEELERLKKLDPKDRSVVGEDGNTLFFPVIRSPFILHIIFWTKFKIFLVASSTVAVAASALATSGAGQVVSPVIYGVTGVLGFSCATFMVAGEFLRRTVGILYLSEDGNRVRVARVSFFGNRRNFELPLTDIIPLTDTGEDIRQACWKIRLYPDCPVVKQGLGKVLYVVGGSKAVVNPEKFNDIFGQVVRTTDNVQDGYDKDK